MSRCTALVIATAVIGAVVTGCGSATHGSGSTGVAQEQPLTTSQVPQSSASTSATRTPTAASSSPTQPSRVIRSSAAPHTQTYRPPVVGSPLPLGYSTGDATQVITATAASMSSTSGAVQAWQKSSGGWTRVGPAIPAWFGSQGLTNHMSEQIAATPVGSYTLTQAFGHDPDPGTGLPYFQTDNADWWMSETSGPDARLYNTHQRCTTSSCPFDAAAPNEHLATELPYYDYAVVIDYNTANAPGGVRVGAGSAVFLHVTDGSPTAGCVAIDQARLVAIMQWLKPSAHPRILIGVA